MSSAVKKGYGDNGLCLLLSAGVKAMGMEPKGFTINYIGKINRKLNQHVPL